MRDSERARQVAERVAEKIRDVTPERLGSDGWEFTRQHVQHFEDPYLDALNAWGREDSEETRARLRDAAERFVGAWEGSGRGMGGGGAPPGARRGAGMRGHRLPASATAGRGGAVVAATRGAQGITEGSAFLREYGA